MLFPASALDEAGQRKPEERSCPSYCSIAPVDVRRRFAPHQLRHAHAVEMAREDVPLIVIQRQLGHSDLGITSVYLQAVDNAEIIETVHARRAPAVRWDCRTGPQTIEHFGTP